VNKVDVAEVLGCNLRGAIANIQQVAPQATIFEVSARTGAGMMAFYHHLLTLMPPEAGIAATELPQRFQGNARI
jgi:hydrogenase nickel incorporation protein HypB